jgi:pyruvyl transferase EpsO
VLYPDHWNAGDAAIWCGTRRMLDALDVRVDYGCDTAGYGREGLAQSLPEGPILIAGGGNFGDVYGAEHALRLRILADHPGRPVIQLPQSIWFRDPDAIAATAAAIRRHGNTTLLLRDAPSLEFARRHFDAPALLCPDLALALDLSDFPRSPDVPMVAVWRDDRESAVPPPAMPPGSIACDWLLGGRALTPDEARAMSTAGLAFHRSAGRPDEDGPGPVRRRWAWRHHPYLWDQLAEDRCRRGCRVLVRGRVTVTNRLHGHLLCLLLGQPHVACDVVNGKVFAYRDTWPEAHRLARFANSAEEAATLAAEMLERLAPDGAARP